MLFGIIHSAQMPLEDAVAASSKNVPPLSSRPLGTGTVFSGSTIYRANSSDMNIRQQIIAILCQSLNIDARNLSMQENTALLGAIPELDSMAITLVLTTLEDHFGFAIEDDEITAAVFESVQSLTDFVVAKLNH